MSRTTVRNERLDEHQSSFDSHSTGWPAKARNQVKGPDGGKEEKQTEKSALASEASLRKGVELSRFLVIESDPHPVIVSARFTDSTWIYTPARTISPTHPTPSIHSTPSAFYPAHVIRNIKKKNKEGERNVVHC